jgi:predicted kinase/chorismate mutase
MKQKVILTKGLPASGKSTWTKQYIKEHPGFKRVNRDDLRMMIDNGEWSEKNEKKIIIARNGLIRSLLDAGANVIVDETNLNPKAFNALQEFLENLEQTLEIEIKDFTDVPLDECIKRDQKRSNYVGEKVIRRFHKQFLAATEEAVEVELVKANPDLPVCILVDVDGTLAKRGNRGVYDFAKAIDDDVYHQTKFLLDLIDEQNRWKNPVVPNITIIIFSGREDKFEDITNQWLNKHDIPYKHVYMRKAGDKRADYIVKKEMYDNIIKDKYNVFFVLDDRKQVVDMWKQNGLYVLGADGTHDY